MPAKTRKDEDRDFARTRDFIVERDYLSTHPHYGPDVPPDHYVPTPDAVTALAEIIRDGFTHLDRPLDDRFEIYASADEMADEILRRLERSTAELGYVPAWEVLACELRPCSLGRGHTGRCWWESGTEDD